MYSFLSDLCERGQIFVHRGPLHGRRDENHEEEGDEGHGLANEFYAGTPEKISHLAKRNKYKHVNVDMISPLTKTYTKYRRHLRDVRWLAVICLQRRLRACWLAVDYLTDRTGGLCQILGNWQNLGPKTVKHLSVNDSLTVEERRFH